MKNKKVKTILIIILSLVIISAVIFFAYKIKIRYENISCYGEKANSNPVELVAHRGYSANAPENTLAAFTEAGKCGEFYGAECDVMLTKDNVWVIMHDDTVERTTNGTGNVRELTYQQISQLTIDFGYGLDKYPDEKVPTFEQYLEVCREYNLRPFIEIKMNATKQQVEDLYSVIEKYGYADSCTVISFFYDSLKSLREIDKDISIFALSTKIDDKAINLCAENGFGLDFCESKQQNTLKLLNSIHERGIELAAWTISTQSAYQRLTDNGVKIITCNSPQFTN